MADVWAPLRYGWGHVYWLTIEGVPAVWCERALGKTLPSGYLAESATLVVDDSARVGAMVERDAAIGAGFPLSFRLLDGAIDAYMTRPTAQTSLTQSETSSATTLHVTSTTGITSPVWVGRERVTYTGSTATTLTGCTRGSAGYAWPHRSQAVVVSGAPRSWRGRLVTLYAQPIDPTGYAPGAQWATTSTAIWRGYLDAEPQRSRDGDGWMFEAAPLDRLLARPLPPALTGTVVDTEPRFKIASDHIHLDVRRYTAGGVETYTPLLAFPFKNAGYATGDWISLTEAHAAIVAAMNAAISAAGEPWLGDFGIVQSLSNYKNSTINKGDWVPTIGFVANNATSLLITDGWWFGTEIPRSAHNFGANGLMLSQSRALGVAYDWSPYNTTTPHETKWGAPRVTVRFDDGDPGSLPSTGSAKIGEKLYKYGAVLQTHDASLVQLAGVLPIGAAQAGASTVEPGMAVEVRIADAGTLADIALDVIHSSGEAALRGAYDTLPTLGGYGLPTDLVDDDTIAARLATGLLAPLELQASLPGESLDDVVGGLLRLAGLALVVTDRPGVDAELTAIDTSATASGAAVELRDEHVITYPGREAEQRQIEAPTSASVLVVVGGDTVATHRVIDVDRARDEGAGRRGDAAAAEYQIPSDDVGGAALLAGTYGVARVVGDSLASVVDIDVVPWLAVRPGDAVDVVLTLPELWDWSAGETGYVGRARCVGRDLSLQTGAQRLRLLIDGQALKGANICPSVAISAVAGGATTPTSVDVELAYVDIMSTAYTQRGGTYMRLLYYEPGGGSEGTSHYLDVSAVTDTGTVCRLTVAAYSLPGGGVSTSQGWVTWPHSASDDAWQAQWMHDADGTRWV